MESHNKSLLIGEIMFVLNLRRDIFVPHVSLKEIRTSPFKIFKKV